VAIISAPSVIERSFARQSFDGPHSHPCTPSASLLTLLFARDAYVTIGVILLFAAAIAVVGTATLGVPRGGDGSFGIPVRFGRRA
jgi:hypothetical protein